ncbi:MAG: SRPBCC domain-containing protein [Gemmatimonadaceae bacterium]
MNATLHHHGDQHTLTFERWLDHPRDTAWRAITDKREVPHWFPAEIHGAREDGARLRFVFPNDEGPPTEGRMLVFDPPRVMEFDWNREILRFELEERDGGTFLLFTHTFTDLAKSARDASGWTVCLDALESRLEGEDAEPFTPERFDALFSDFAVRFGPEASARREPD